MHSSSPAAGYLASPQLSIPGTPTDYTAFSTVLQQDLVLCNTNSIFSPMPEEYTQTTGSLPPLHHTPTKDHWQITYAWRCREITKQPRAFCQA